MGSGLPAGQSESRAPLALGGPEEFVRRAWPSEDPIGQRVGFDRDADGNFRWREVVGVIRHQKHYNLNTIDREQAYFPFSQGRVTSMLLAARVAGDPMAIAASIRRRVLRTDVGTLLPTLRVPFLAIHALNADPDRPRRNART